jgi:A/G-specific adenine glycosylase
MDFGATLCKPVPLCVDCFFSHQCRAYKSGRQNQLPVKEKKTHIRERWFQYVLVQHRGLIAIRQRVEKDIWQQLFEFLLLETDFALSEEAIREELQMQYGIPEFELVCQEQGTQKLSHQTIHFQIFHIKTRSQPRLKGFEWVDAAGLKTHPFPRKLQQFIGKNLFLQG